MKNYKIVCGKFDNDIYFNQNYLDNHKIRIGSSNPNKLKSKIYELIATDGQRILYKNKLYEVTDIHHPYKLKLI